MNQETKLGMFVLVGAVCLIVSIMLIGDYQFRSTYRLNVMFDNVTGLPSKAKVKIAGVEVGGVSDVKLEKGKARVIVYIKSGVEIHQGSKAKIVATGLIGSKFLEFTMGDPNAPLLKDNDYMTGITAASLDDMVSNAMDELKKLVDSFSGPGGNGIGSNLGETMDNLNKISGTLKRAIADQEDKVTEIIDNVHSFTGDMSEITKQNKASINEAITNVKDASEKLDAILVKIDKGQGIIGQLTSDKEMADEVKQTVSDIRETAKEAKTALKRLGAIHTDWEYTQRYDGKYQTYRSDAGLKIIPEPDKYYYIGVSNIGDRAIATPDIEDINTIDFLIGKKFGPSSFKEEDWGYAPLEIYGGAIRSKGGFGLGYRPFWKWEPWRKLEITARASNFTRKTPVNKAKVDLGAKVDITKWAAIGAQIEDTYYESNVNSYVNIAFRDDDVAYVLGLVGLARP